MSTRIKVAQGSNQTREVLESNGCIRFENVNNLERLALKYATEAHASINQRRKYTGEPYITHPIAVADLVSTVDHTEAMLCAALLHDTVEDTNASLFEIRGIFGREVAEMVEMLTDVSTPEDGNRAQRKAIDRAHTEKASPQAKTIKLADLIDNTSSIVEHDKDFAKIYLAEKRLLLEVLRDGDLKLWLLAQDMLMRGEYELRKAEES